MNTWSSILKSLRGSKAARANAEAKIMEETILEKMPTPLILAKQIAELLATVKFRDEDEKKWAQRCLKLNGLFGGMDVLCKDTDEGTQIIASGSSEEVAKCLESFSDEALRSVYIERPPYWKI